MQELDFAYKLRDGDLIYIGQPRQIRNDCQIGQWKAGASKMLGDEMDAQGLNDIESEAMGELGNIMVNAGLSAIADSLHVLLESTVTCYKQYSNDTIVTLIQQENNVENILVTHVNLMISGNALLGGKLIMLLNNGFNQEIAEKIELSAT